MHKGNAISSLPAGHYFYITELQRYGLAVMSRDDWRIIRNEAIADLPKILAENKSAASIFDLFEAMGVGEFKFKRATIDGGYEIKTYTTAEVSALIDYIDGAVNDAEDTGTSYKDRISNPDLRGMEKQISEIQNSPEGCLIANRNWETGKDVFKSATASAGNTVAVSSSVKLYFHKKHKELTDRVPSFTSRTLYTAHPRRRSGAKYAFKQSLKEDTGVYLGKVNLTEDNYASMVSAPLKLIYNHSEGVWENSSSFLCMLLEDVDAAQIIDPGVSPNSLNYDSNEFYGKEAISSVSDFTTGLAMPLSIQENNPRAFGPNLIKYDGETKLEKVRIVNRTTQFFTKGEIALVQQIDGENILIKISGDGVIEERPPSFTSPWLFSKFLASSDDYFRLDNGDFIQAGDEVVNFLHNKIYAFEGRNLATGYFQDNALNQTKSNLARPNKTTGSLTKNSYSERINLSVPTEDSTSTFLDDITTDQVNMFWGPVFVQGYSGRKFKDGEDEINEFQIPAEVAALGPLKNAAGEDDGSPIENHGQVVAKINAGEIGPLSNLRYEQARYVYASGWNAKPSNNGTTIQFSLCPAEHYAHLDVNTRVIPDGKLDSYAAEKCRNFYDAAADFHGMPAGTNLFGGATFPSVTSQAIADDHLYDERQSSAGPLYDCYVQKEPSLFHMPMGCYDMFGDDNANPAYSGANAVGTTCGRRVVFKKGSWSLNVDTEQVFGTQGVFFGGGGGGSVNLSILPFIGSWVNDTRGKTISGTTVVWGSSLDRIESFGTAALHVQVYDGWPREDTLWLSQYAQPLHFNQGAYGSQGAIFETEVQSWDDDNKEFDTVTIQTRATETRVDYRVPTRIDYAYFNEDRKNIYTAGLPLDGDEIGVGLVDPSVQLRPERFWIAKFDRRGHFITKYGHFWKKKVIGVGGDTSVLVAGSKFSVGQRIGVDEVDGLSITVEAVDENGGIESFRISNTSEYADECQADSDSPFCPLITPSRTSDSGVEIENFKLRGEGVVPADFLGGPLQYVVDGGTGGDVATITFSSAYCWERPMWDYGPKDQSGLIRTSLPSTNGQKRVTGYKTTTIGVESNEDSPFPGQYEIFTYCHNDIGIFLQNDPDITTGYQMHSYIKATFS